LVPFSCVAFSPSAVFTFTVASPTAYTADDAAFKYGRNLSPDNRRGHSAPPARSLIEAAPGAHPAKARRIADNIAKLPELLRKT